MKSFISVIIPTTRAINIPKILDAFLAQTIDQSRFEVIFVHSNSLKVPMKSANVRYIPVSEQTNAAKKRNYGMEMARGDIYLFIDDDCIPALNLIELHLEQQLRGKLIVGGAIIFNRTPYLQLSDNISAFHDLLHCTSAGTRPYLATANLSVNHEVIKVGGVLNPMLDRAHDLEWTVRFRAAGYTLYFDPRALVLHDPPRNSWHEVWAHWFTDAHDTLIVRLSCRHYLKTPRLASMRSIYFWGSPFIALWATLRTFNQFETLLQYGHTLPVVYITKLIWCWGAFKNFPQNWDKL